MGTIIDGRKVSELTRASIKEEAELLKERFGVEPTLAVIMVGNNPASAV